MENNRFVTPEKEVEVNLLTTETLSPSTPVTKPRTFESPTIRKEVGAVYLGTESPLKKRCNHNQADLVAMNGNSCNGKLEEKLRRFENAWTTIEACAPKAVCHYMKIRKLTLRDFFRNLFCTLPSNGENDKRESCVAHSLTVMDGLFLGDTSNIDEENYNTEYKMSDVHLLMVEYQTYDPNTVRKKWYDKCWPVLAQIAGVVFYIVVSNYSVDESSSYSLYDNILFETTICSNFPSQLQKNVNEIQPDLILEILNCHLLRDGMVFTLPTIPNFIDQKTDDPATKRLMLILFEKSEFPNFHVNESVLTDLLYLVARFLQTNGIHFRVNTDSLRVDRLLRDELALHLTHTEWLPSDSPYDCGTYTNIFLESMIKA